VNRRGRSVECEIRITPMVDARVVRGAIILIETIDANGEGGPHSRAGEPTSIEPTEE